MGKPLVTRKRVHAFRRAPDGSAFQRCDRCDASVAIALLDMHEHECGGKSKRCRVSSEGLAVHDQPRSPFCFFMENYMRDCKAEEWMEIGKAAFKSWVNMTPKEKQPFVNHARRVNSAYLKTLLEEVSAISGEEDEADSAMVGKFDPDYKNLLDYDECFESLDTDLLPCLIQSFCNKFQG